MKRKLIQIETCPYCRNARDKLDKAGIAYDIININPGNRSLVQQLSGQPSVPILVNVWGEKDQDDDIIDNLDIISQS